MRGRLRAPLAAAVVVLAFVCPLFRAAPAEGAPLPLRVGLVWDRWAVDISGLPGTGTALSMATGWPGQGTAGAAVLKDGGRFSVSASSTVVAATASESPWLARAVAVSLARTGVKADGVVAGLVPAKLGGLWFVLYDLAADADLQQSRAEVQRRSLPAYTLLWPSVPARGGRTESPCAVPLSGPLSGLSFSAPVPLTLSPGGGVSRVTHGTRTYRGRLEVLPAGGARLFSLVNVVDIEDYLLGVVPSEMPAAWPLEALKAQAVAARTYAVSNLGKHRASGFDLCDDIHCQAYLGYSNEYPGPAAAVRATAGIVATYRGRLINAVYHAHAGGATDSSAVIWGTAEPYLVGTGTTYERPYFWTATNRRTEVESAVAAMNQGDVPEGLFPLLTAVPGNLTPGGRARAVALSGPGATGSVSASSLRSKLGTYRLRSGAFSAQMVGTAWLWPGLLPAAGISGGAQAVTWAPGDRGAEVMVLASQAAAPAGAPFLLGLLSPEFFVFSGQGFGHGVGMSQWGAREMALAGKNFRQILSQFYQGISLSTNYGR